MSVVKELKWSTTIASQVSVRCGGRVLSLAVVGTGPYTVTATEAPYKDGDDLAKVLAACVSIQLGQRDDVDVARRLAEDYAQRWVVKQSGSKNTGGSDGLAH